MAAPVAPGEFTPLTRLFFGDVPLVVAHSLRTTPADWVAPVNPFLRVPYRIEHRTARHYIWVANSAYGVEVNTRNGSWGGVTTLSSFGLSPGHWLVWAAARTWLRNHGPRVAPKPDNSVLRDLLEGVA